MENKGFIIIIVILILFLILSLFAGIEPKEELAVFGELSARTEAMAIIIQKDVYVNVTGLNATHIQGVESDNESLTILTAGFYKIDSQFSFSDGANTEYHLALGRNGVRENHCHSQRKIGTGGDVGSASFTCIDEFMVEDKITIMIENVNNVQDPTIQSINLNVILLT